MFNLFLAIPAVPLPFVDTIWPAVMIILTLTVLGYITPYKLLLLLTVPFIVAQAIGAVETDILYALGLISMGLINVYVAFWRPSEV